ncbi:hypothetical protein DL93DRAFT_2103475 [Clavulina sp. PMI_390]|nr:hypothetical protein DL93DRAFT_2103475 [Clavulina sp. PMI_390]
MLDRRRHSLHAQAFNIASDAREASPTLKEPPVQPQYLRELRGYWSRSIHELLSTLRPHIHRFWRIEVCTSEEELQLSPITQTIQAFGLVCPALRSVRLADRTRGKSAYLEHSVELIPFWNQCNTQIESIDIKLAGAGEVLEPYPSVKDFHLPVGLRRLRIFDTLSKDLVINIARHCPNLEYFEWHFGEDETPHELTPLHLPYLKSFKLGELSLNGGFPPLIASRCESLCLDSLWYSEYNDWLFGSSQATMPRFPALRRVSFVHNYGYPNNLHDFLSCHPTLEELLICGPDDAPRDEAELQEECELFNRLSLISAKSKSSPSNNPSQFLPALHTLWYEVELYRWIGNPDAEVAGIAIYNALHELLTLRATLSVKILRVVKNETIPRELLHLLEEFEGRFFVLNHDAPDWAR